MVCHPMVLRIMDVIDNYDPDFIYTDGNSTQPFSGDKSGSGFKSDALQRVIAYFYNHTLQKRGKVDTFSIIKFHPPTKGIVNTFEGNYPRNIKTDQPWIGENAVGDWFYAPNFTYDAGAIVRYLLECVSRDGCYMVCISLQPDGSLDEGSQNMLKELGQWMTINSPGIYGSKAWVKLGEGKNGKLRTLPGGQLGKRQADFAFGPEDFRFTVGKDGSLYAYCLTVPAPGTELKIASLGTDAKLLEAPIKSVSLLGGKDDLEWHQQPDGLVINCPAEMLFKISVGFKIN